MPVAAKPLMLLPVLALIAGCNPHPYSHDTVAVAPTPPPPPALPGALGVPAAPGYIAPLSGSTVAPGVAPTTPVRMSATEVAGTLANNTAEGVATNGLPYAAYFTADGHERFREGNFTDIGTWRVLPDGRFCSALVQLSTNTEECYVMYRVGNNLTFERPDGTTVGNVTVVRGNPQGL
jgi:hypothetical protein